MSDENEKTSPDGPGSAIATETKDATANGDMNGSKEQVEQADPNEVTDTARSEQTSLQNGADAADAADAAEAVPETSGEAIDKEKKGKRKSIANTPSKKLTKKKSMPVLHLACQPGEYYWARMKGHPAWPAIIADESMLPEQLLATRPISTTRPDGWLRDDFKEGGKNAKERTYAVMYLGTNEFSWINNTNLTPLNPAECEELPKTKGKMLAEAYELATQQHDLDYFKGLLEQAREENQKIAEERQRVEEEAARKAEEKQAKAEEKKKKPRKSKSMNDEDVEMEDADAPKSTKKRKKGEESDGEAIKPKKTPKVTKLNGPKTPADAETPTSKKPSAKPKKKVAAPKAEEEVEDVKISEEEREAQLAKSILYFRHRLQKGFLTRDESPKESEMATMAEYFAQLQNYEDLPPSIIRQTKIHKVLKAIVKLSSIPKEEEYNFKKRSSALLEVWNKRMEADGDAAATKTPSAKEKEPETNGDTTKVLPSETIPEDNGGSTTSKLLDDADTAAATSDKNEAAVQETGELGKDKKESDIPATSGESLITNGA